MGRTARYYTTTPNGINVGYGFKSKGGFFRVQFKHPTENRYIDPSTGVPVPPKWTPDRSPPREATEAAPTVIAAAYTTPPDEPADPKKASWETVLADLGRSADLRPRSLEVYTSTFTVLRSYVPTTGP